MSDKPAIVDVMALSPLQQGLYSLAGLTDSEAGADPYFIAMAADVSGQLDADLLRSCAEAMLERHPNIRVSFFQGNLSRPVAVVPAIFELPWQHVVVADADEAAALELQARTRPFDLARGPAIRFVLAELPDARWRLVVVAHHIVIDGWSLPVFVSELMALYGAGGDTAVLPAARPYRDYIGWLAARDPQISRQRWRTHLDGLDGPTMLTPALSGEVVGGLPERTETDLDERTTEQLFEAARARGVTVSTLFQMAWATILSAFTDRDDVVFGVTVSGRPDELSGVESMVGLFINTVPLRIRLHPGERAGSQCLAVQRDAAEMRDHSFLSHAELRTAGGIGEMYDTLLVYENFPPGGLVGSGDFEMGDAVIRPAALESLSHFPVTIAAHPTHGRLTVLVETLSGALGLLDPATLAQRVLVVVQRLLAGWDRPLRDIAVTLDGEIEVTATQPVPAAGGIHTAIAAMAAQRPDAPALSWDSGTLTYRELDAAADRVAAELQRRGVTDETPVPILAPRGPDYVVAMLGVLKAGGLIVPLDPGMPAERIQEIIAQTGAHVVVDQALLAGVGDDATDLTVATVRPGQGAYIIFTSGTTGKPKGVIGTHQAVLAYGADHADRMLRPARARLGRDVRIAHAWSFTFDAAWQPLVALFDGHCVHIISDGVQRDAEALVAEIGRFGIDMIDTTPSMFSQLRAAGLLSTVPLAVLALGGENIDTAAWQGIRTECDRSGMRAHNCYGPTETTVEAVVAAIADHPQPCIGEPTAPTTSHVLDSWLRAVPDGVAGELYLSGGQLTRGYLGRPGETSARFIADPTHPGRRMYRTGDIVRRLPDSGALQYLGRSDDQVKIRGFRVEPGEVVAALYRHPEVRHAHVAVRRHRSGPRLTAYVVLADPETGARTGRATTADLRRMLTATLPRYLVPHHIIEVEQIPLTSHGKVDDRSLAALDADRGVGAAAEFAAPGTETEIVIAEVLAELLDTRVVDVNADFLDLGLDSIVALSVVQAVRRRGIALRARLMLECATVRELATAIDTDVAAEPIDVDDTGPIPLLPAGHWLLAHGDARRLAQTEAIRMPADVTRERLEVLLGNVIDGHEALRCRLDRTTMSLVEQPRETGLLTEASATGDLAVAVAEHTDASIQRLDPERGTMFDAVWLHHDSGAEVLVLTAHVLAMDPASWQIVLGELETGWHALAAGHNPAPVSEHTSLRQWSRLLAERALKLDTCEFWERQLDGPDPDLGARRVRPDIDRAADAEISMAFVGRAVTAQVLAAPAGVPAVLAAATARAITAWRRLRGLATPTPLLAIETHGRADIVVSAGLADNSRQIDTGDTVGLLSAIYPVRLAAQDALGVAAELTAVPGDGIDYALLRHLRTDTAERLGVHRDPQLMLNYLGRLRQVPGRSALTVDRALLNEVSRIPEPNLAIRHEITLNVLIIDKDGAPVLGTQWRTLPDILSADDVATMQALWQDALREVIS
ncbi:amino acid adenylation domain-containing protein [Mycolicibacterium bacteremicum]|uniref:amino acid adenylation domain-containing protein n=1 Tax=Mycolicibacterium bacteremicum TaxID=564198 RepID=UPI0026EC3036|nr:amino acid adenylation domain-containing protein [Mycolicibacterium bacteremicum]